MADTLTPLLSLIKVEVGQSYNTWGEKLNENMDVLDEAVGAIAPTQLDGYAAPGLVAVDEAGDFVGREIEVGTGLSIEDGDGAAGNPSIDFDLNALAAKSPPADADLVLIADATSVPDAYAARKATRTALLTRATHTSPRLATVNLGTTASGITTVNLSNGNHFIVEFGAGAGRRLNFTNKPTSGVMEVTVDMTFAISGTLDASQGHKWAGGTVPTLAAGRHIVKYWIYPTETIGAVIAEAVA